MHLLVLLTYSHRISNGQENRKSSSTPSHINTAGCISLSISPKIRERYGNQLRVCVCTTQSDSTTSRYSCLQLAFSASHEHVPNIIPITSYLDLPDSKLQYLSIPYLSVFIRHADVRTSPTPAVKAGGDYDHDLGPLGISFLASSASVTSLVLESSRTSRRLCF